MASKNLKKKKNGKSVLVTGADGFVGSHLTELLLREGYEVKALSFYNSFNNWGWLEDIPKNNNLTVVTGDVRDSSFCDQITKNIDLVFHLAALIAIPYSYEAPESYIDTNIRGTFNICQSARKNKVKKVIHTSTSEVYGTAKYVPIDEDHPMQPQSPYSASKISADSIAMSFYNSFSLPVVIARPFNIFGPRQSARAIIPSIISQISSNKKIIKLGDLRPTRDFTYVTDTCLSLLNLSKSNKALGEVVNIGSGNEISIDKLVKTISRIMNIKVSVRKDTKRLRPKRSEVFRLVCNNSKLRKISKNSPNLPFEEGLRKTIEWFLMENNLEKYKTDMYNL